MKKVVVIGAGISGLTAAIYAQRSGFDVTLVEQHSIVGGMCTSWKRKGYLFEGAVHWLTGSNPKTEMYQVWKETGALSENVPILLHDIFRSVECEEQIIHLYRDIDKTAEHLIKISPGDRRQINRLVKDVKTLCNMRFPIFDVKGVKAENPKRMSFKFLHDMLHALPAMNRLGKMSCKDFAEQFKHPGIQRLLRIIPDEYAASSLIFTLATLNNGDGGYPEGGSLAMLERMAKTFMDIGGELRLKTKVQKVNTANGAVTGVTLEDEAINSDAVIVTQETIAALDNLFDVTLKDVWLQELRRNTKPAVCTFVSVGVRAEITKVPEWQLQEPIVYAGKTIESLGFNSYFGYEGYAPEGCTALTTALLGDTYDFWKHAKDSGRYEEEKQALSNQISHALCQKYPQAAGNIEVIDIATPLTYERYTGAYRGSWMAIMKPGCRMKQYPGLCESISGLYFAGHRMIVPGGLPVAAESGRRATQMVCRQFDKMFRNV